MKACHASSWVPAVQTRAASLSFILQAYTTHSQVDGAEVGLRGCRRSLLEGPAPANGAVVAATTQGVGISTQLLIPRPKGSLVQVRRLPLCSH